MFYNDLINTDFFAGRMGRGYISDVKQDGTTYPVYYQYWIEQLFERIMRLFVWENTGVIKPKEIEQRLLLAGKCAIAKMPKEQELTAFFCSFFGVTKYVDEFTNVNIRCPIYAGQRTIGVDCEIIDNTSLRNPALPLINHYATLLAHTEVSLVNCLVNARDSGGVPVVGTENQKQSLQNYFKKKYNGQYGSVTDAGNLGIEMLGVRRGTEQDVKSILETRSGLLKSFYSDIGVRAAFEKNNNAVVDEVTSDTSLLLLNLSDMIDSRKKACERINKLFGVDFDVHIAKEINYNTENEVKKDVVRDENDN